MMFYLRRKYIEKCLTKAWSIDIREKVIFANTKSQKIYGYIFSKLMLDFSLQIKYFDMEWEFPIKINLEIENIIKHKKQIFMVLWDKNYCLASKASTYFYYRKNQ